MSEDRRGDVLADASTIPALFRARCQHSPQDLAYRFYVGRGWRDATWGQWAKRVDEVAAGLLMVGIQPGDHIAILGDTRPEWGTSDLASLCVGGVTVGLYHNAPPQQWARILQESNVVALFVDRGERLDGVRRVRDVLPSLRHVVVWDAPGALQESKGELSLFTLMQRGRAERETLQQQLDARARNLQADSPANIAQTSGSKGQSRAVVLEHRHILATLRSTRTLAFQKDDIALRVWPTGHAVERVLALYGSIVHNVALAYARAGDTRALWDDLAEIRPTILGGTPRFFAQVYAQAQLQAETKGPTAHRLFLRATRAAQRYSQAQRGLAPLSPWLRAEHRLMDRLVFRHIRALLGGRARLLGVCVAPLSLFLLEFFHGAGLLIFEAYGTTETAALAVVNTPQHCALGTAGKPLEGVDIQFAQDGEIMVHGAGLAAHYNSGEALETWFATGDVGQWEEGGFLKVLGRKHEFLVTSTGRRISPRSIESLVEADPYVSHCVVLGKERPFFTALVALDAYEVPRLCEKLGVTFRGSDVVVEEEAILAYVARVVERANQQLVEEERLGAFRLLPRDLSVESGELTPVFTVRRQQVQQLHKTLVEEMYA